MLLIENSIRQFRFSNENYFEEKNYYFHDILSVSPQHSLSLIRSLIMYTLTISVGDLGFKP